MRHSYTNRDYFLPGIFLFLFLVPVIAGILKRYGVFLLNNDVRISFEHIFIWMAVLSFAYYTARHINFWVGLFIVLATWSSFYPMATILSKETHRLVMFGSLLYVASVQILNTDKRIEYFLNAICIIALVHVFLIVLQAFNINVLGSIAVKPKWEGMFFDPVPNIGIGDCPNTASAIIAFSFIAFCRKYWNYAIPFLITGFYLTSTFGGPLSVVCAIIFAVLYYCPKWKLRAVFIGIMALGLSMYALFIDKPDTTWRYLAWKQAIVELYPQRPVFGSGLGHWQLVFGRSDIARRTFPDVQPAYIEIMGQAHNEFIQGLFEMGILFVVIVIGYFINVYRRFNPDAILSVSALMIICGKSMVFFPFHVGLTAGLGVMWLAVLERQLRHV